MSAFDFSKMIFGHFPYILERCDEIQTLFIPEHINVFARED